MKKNRKLSPHEFLAHSDPASTNRILFKYNVEKATSPEDAVRKLTALISRYKEAALKDIADNHPHRGFIDYFNKNSEVLSGEGSYSCEGCANCNGKMNASGNLYCRPESGCPPYLAATGKPPDTVAPVNPTPPVNTVIQPDKYKFISGAILAAYSILATVVIVSVIKDK